MDVGSLQNLGIGAGTLRQNNLSLPLSPITAVPFALLLFPLFVMVSLRPVSQSLVTSRWSLVGILSFPTSNKQLATSNFLRSWNFYVQCCRQFPLSLTGPKGAPSGLPRALVLFTILEAFLMPLPAYAGPQDTAPPSDENYFYFLHDDQLGSSHILTEGNESSTHAGIVYNRGEILQRFEYDPFGTEKFVLHPVKYDLSRCLRNIFP
jgi:hypothetical protein